MNAFTLPLIISKPTMSIVQLLPLSVLHERQLSVLLLMSSPSDDLSDAPSKHNKLLYYILLVNYLLPSSDLLPNFISFLLLIFIYSTPCKTCSFSCFLVLQRSGNFLLLALLIKIVYTLENDLFLTIPNASFSRHGGTATKYISSGISNSRKR